MDVNKHLIEAIMKNVRPYPFVLDRYLTRNIYLILLAQNSLFKILLLNAKIALNLNNNIIQ
jgi:hypothetical protein